jgi:methionyl-tRNA formyltransferase
LHQARVSDANAGDATAGTCIAASARGITIACGDGRAIDVLQLQPEGRRSMSARDYLAGHGMLVGQRFG